MSASPVIASPVYGLRTWTVAGEPGDERLAGPYQAAPWPTGGDWIEASCPKHEAHSAPAPGCGCGIHAFHPRPRAARRILASRREIPGVVKASGTIEVHEDGFRAERARPHALLLAPGRNAGLAHRLGKTYDVPVVEAADADDVLGWCREHEMGLSEPVVVELLGEDELEARRRALRAEKRANVFRFAAALLVAAVLLALGLAATDSPGGRTLHGRAGDIHTH